MKGKKAPFSDPAALERYRAGYLKYRSVLFDRTTELPAFPLLFDPLRSALDQRRQLGVLHIECANLELVESLYGWQQFDRILRHTASTLRKAIGEELPETTLLALDGVAGDRFAAFVLERAPGRDVDGAYLTELGRRLCDRLEEAFAGGEYTGMSPELVFRVGQALLSQDPFYRFERRVYRALDEAGRFNAERERRRELSWGEELQRIIRDGAVDTVFQPVVELSSNAVLGHEALARGPRGSIFEMPRAMFELSSRIGVEAELDRVCRDAALRASAALIGTGKLFLNALPQGLEERDAEEEALGRLIRAVEREPRDLVWEFSERAAEHDPECFIASIERARQRGFGIALDNVGTGPGYREIIERGRPDYLKLDGSLVHEIEEDLLKQELLSAVVKLAAEIDAAVIAEAVENEAQARTLARIGARYGQGYYFAVPAAAPAGQAE